jgi:outer membrane lipoprotein-sorting protein
MQARLLTRVAASIAMGAGMGAAAIAQTAKAPAAPEWSQTVTKEATGGGQELDAKQTEIVQKLTTYFNEMVDSKGVFIQTSADGKRLRGKIYIKRPSSFRFEYNLPSRQLIISDGKSMIIQDLDLKTDDRWGLDQTPFRIVLRKDVDLMRDAKILEVGETDDRYFILLTDKSPDTRGRLKLFFLKQPAVELKEWITTDTQGQDTKVELTEFVRAENLDSALFVPPPVFLQKLQQ